MITQNTFICKKHLDLSKKQWNCDGEKISQDSEEEKEEDPKQEVDDRFVHIDLDGNKIYRTVFRMDDDQVEKV